MGVGGIQNARFGAAGLVRSVVCARQDRRVRRHTGERLSGKWRPSARGAGGHILSRRGDAGRVPRSRARARHVGGRSHRGALDRGDGAMSLAPDQIQQRVAELGEWFHNLDLCGVQTAPNHFLGDYPAFKWRNFAHAIPADLHGKTVLDIGCNGGFYSIEMKKRGAVRVLGVDIDDRYLNQARFAAETLGLHIEFEKRSVYEIGALAGQFDYVLFMGVFYHLRYPLWALDNL